MLHNQEEGLRMKSPILFRTVLGLAVLAVTAVLARQHRSITTLRATMDHLRSEVAVGAPAHAPSSARPISSARVSLADRPAPRPAEPDPAPLRRTEGADQPDAGLSRRVAALEASVAQLGQGADHLMDQGEIPPSEAKAGEWQARFLDTSESARDRLSMLRMLRRSGHFDDQMAYAAATWLNTATDSDEKRYLLERLRGAENPVLKQVTLQLAATAEDPRVRSRAAANLREFAEDPAVESALWRMVSDETSGDVRRQAEEALRRLPLDEQRLAGMRTEAVNPGTTVEKRAAVLRILQANRQDIGDIAIPMARAAESAGDGRSLMAYIQAFDDVNHPEFMAPLVNAVQDQDADIRRRAADALIDYRGEPAVEEWLVYLTENDPDPEVRREASRVFREDGRRDGRPSRR